MDRDFIQVTPENMNALAHTLRRLAKRGDVEITTKGNIVGKQPFIEGQLVDVKISTFRVGGTTHVIQCEIDGGLVLQIPVAPDKFVPAEDGDAVAWYRVKRNVVEIEYQTNLDVAHREFCFPAR